MTFGTLKKDAQGTPVAQGWRPGDEFIGAQISELINVDGSTNESAGMVTSDQVQNAIMLGMAFVATTGVRATATNPNLVMGMSVFNSSSSGKSLYIFSIKWHAPAATTTIKYHLTTVDPAYASSITQTKLKAGGATASIATVTSAADAASASISTSGTQQDMLFNPGAGTFEFLPDGCGIYLPAGASNGVAVYGTIATAGNSWGASVRWLEF